MQRIMTSLLFALIFFGCQPEQIDPIQIPGKQDPIAADSTVAHLLTSEDTLDELPPDSLSYLALGDSYTIGQSVPVEERWPVQLAAKLNEETPLRVKDPKIVAVTGWTTTNLSNGMDAAEVDTMEWDVVSLLIGVNNQYQGLPLPDYEDEYTELLERAINLVGGDINKVFVVSIPDYGYTPFGVNNQTVISAELANFNASCQSITESYGVAHYNITPISQQWPDVPDLVAPDNLHPSGYQYTLWVDSFWESVKQQLTSN